MPNIKSIITAHNRKILNNKEPDTAKKQCNCWDRKKCPLNEKCLTNQIVYQANINSDLEDYKENIYKGLCEKTFKLRYAEHKNTFNYQKYKNDMELANELWEIKLRNGTPNIKWKKLCKSSSYNINTKRCNLCLREKYEILTHKGDNLLNKRSEIISTCRHKRKYLLSSCKT